jgi:divalent metal cation (Fe/Co/Zn/Cd) transporter
VTTARPAALPAPHDDCCPPGRPACPACAARPRSRPGFARPEAGRPDAARAARRLAWASLAWMCAEGGVGLWQGLAAGSAALTGWALGSAVEGLASIIVIWRFTGVRALSETAERRAQRGVAVSFWLLAPFVAAESAGHLADGHRVGVTAVGLVLTAVAVVVMPLLGWAKHRLGARLDSAATAGEGAQNYLCAAQAAAVLAGLAVSAVWSGGWWADPAAGLAIAAAAAWEGLQSWRGDDCC